MVTVPILFGREKCNGFLGIEKFLGRGEYPAEARPRVFRLDGGSLHFCIPR